MFSKHQVAGMSKIFNILQSLQQLNDWDFGIFVTSLVDLICFETWSSDENTCICFCRGDQIISCMLRNSSAALSTNQVCSATKHKIKHECLQFFIIWEEEELSKYESLRLLLVGIFLFQAKIMWQYDCTKHNLDTLLDCILCLHSIAGPK